MGHNEAWQQEPEQLADSRGPASVIHHPSPSLTLLKCVQAQGTGGWVRMGRCALGPYFLVHAGCVSL